MSDASEPASQEAQEALAGALCTALAGDLSGLLERTVELSNPSVTALAAGEAAAPSESCVVLPCHGARGPDEPGVALNLRIGAPDAITMASLQQGKPPEEIATLRAGAVDDEQLAALEGVVKLMAAVLTRLAAEHHGIDALEAGSLRILGAADAASALPGMGAMLQTTIEVGIEGFDASPWTLYLASTDEGTAADAPGGPVVPEGSILVIDPDAEQRERVEDLADEVGRGIDTLDPAALASLDGEALSEVAAIVVAWDLGGRSGLEVMETLRCWPEAAGRPLLLASDAPTRGMVRTGLRAGAKSFLMRPYQADELRRRVLGHR